MSSRPPPPSPIYPPQSSHTAAAVAAAAAATAAAGTLPSISMMATEAHARPAWPHTLPPPHLLANPYTRLPPPAPFPQPPKPPPPSLPLAYSSFRSSHLSSSHHPRPHPIVTTAPRESAMPIDRIISHETFNPAATKLPYSPRRSSQISPRTVPGPTPTFKRTYESPQQLEERAIHHHAPPLPSPSYTVNRGSESSHRSSRTTSSGFGTGPAASHHTTTVPASQASTVDITRRYMLTVRQQPLAARACGFGERDRRVIDPPPIVQLTLADFDPGSPSDVSELRYPFNVVHCTLLSSTTPSADVTAITDPSTHRTTRRLMGTLVASPFVGSDPDSRSSSAIAGSDTNNHNQPISCFFIFPDLSCRTPGPYRLNFTLMRLGSEITLLGGRTQIVSSVTTEVFQVFSAKDFPGMRASTGLTRGLKKLGAGVSVKKGNGGKGKGPKDEKHQEKEESSSEDDDGDERSGDEAVSKTGPQSRAKKRRKG